MLFFTSFFYHTDGYDASWFLRCYHVVDLRARGSDPTVISSIGGPINRKNLLILEELDDETICLHPVQQFLASDQPDLHLGLHPIGQQILLILHIRR